MTPSQAVQIEALDRQLSETDDPLEKARIYLRAGQIYAEFSDIDEACFFMTQAFILLRITVTKPSSGKPDSS